MTVRIAPIVLCAALLWTPAANVPASPGTGGKAGAVTPGGSERLVTRRAGEGTEVMALRRGDGQVLRSRRIAGRWTVPPVTVSGARTGLSADGRTLVLARPSRGIPVKRARPSQVESSELAVLDVASLVVRRQITLPGYFTVDAISPDGRWVYLIQYGGDVLDYRVRALDTRTGRLDPRPIVDPHRPEDQMRGLPMTRAMSRDGRWAYTLYGGGEETFIHALDTVGRTANCIDLMMLPPQRDLSLVSLTVSADGRRIDVRDAGEHVATVDARTAKVSEPGAAHVAPPPSPPDAGGFPWAVLPVVAGLFALAVRLVRRRGRSRLAEPVAPGAQSSS